MICILVRDFASTQEKRLNPDLSGMPLILVEAGKYRPKVIAADAEARQMGVKAGMWLGEARSLCPQAEILPVEENRYQRLFQDLSCELLDITDCIEAEYQATSAAWYSDDYLVLSHLLTAIQKASGIVPQVGIATGKFPARVAAAITNKAVVCEIEAGDEAAFLSNYPVSLLPLDKLMARRLPLLGIQTLGQLADLPGIAIWEQFGKHGRWLHELASGKDIRPLSPFKAAIRISQSISFDEPIYDRQILQHRLAQISLKLVETLNSHEAQQVSLILKLKNGMLLEHHRQPQQAVRDNLYLLRLLQQMLDGFQIEAAVEDIEVRLGDIRERLPVQLALFETKKTVMSLQEVAPRWASRHRQVDFYHLQRIENAFLPEDSIEQQRVSGA